jgi:prevent-host-death family protein
MMPELTIREMREQLGNLDQIVKTEGETVITRRGVPVARLLPIKGAHLRPGHAELRAAMQPLENPSEMLVRDDRDRRY